MPVALITPVLIGAAVGAVSAAISGGNILKGALFGALGGAVGGAISGAFGGATSGTAAGVATSAVGGEVGGVAGGAAADIAAASVAGGADGMIGGLAGDAASSGVAASTAVAGAGPATVGEGLQAAATPSIQAPVVDSGLQTAAPGASSGLQATPATSTGLAGVPPPANPMAGGAKTFLGSLFQDGSSMINSRMGVSMAGEMVKGYAAGKNQEALLEARREDVRDARANARFGVTGSRYNTASMVGPTNYKPQ